MKRTTEQAREAYAAALERQPGYANAAGSVRSGYENIWVRAAIDALEPLVDVEDEE